MKINCHNPINKIQRFSQCIELKNSSVKELFHYTDSPKTHLTKLVQNIISSTFTCWKRKGHWRNKKWTPKHFYWIEYLFPQSRAYSNQYTLLPSNSIILPPTTPYFGFKSSPEDPWLVRLGHSKSEDCFLWAEPLRFSFFFFLACVHACMAEKHDVVTFITFPFVPRRKILCVGIMLCLICSCDSGAELNNTRSFFLFFILVLIFFIQIFYDIQSRCCSNTI